MVQCEDEKTTRQPPWCSNSWRQETRINSNPFTFFFFNSTVQKKRNQNIYFHTVVRSGVSYTQRCGEEHANPPTLRWKHTFIFHLKGSPCQNEYYYNNRCLDQMLFTVELGESKFSKFIWLALVLQHKLQNLSTFLSQESSVLFFSSNFMPLSSK